MRNNRHTQPVWRLVREPRPSDRETRMCPPPGKWRSRLREEKE